MNRLRRGGFRLFQFSGITVFLHWSWFLVAAIEISDRGNAYSSPVWNVFEYLALFLIVTMHEFGHALACRQVGGIADRIVLWPLGGVAYVNPPQRPGAYLWSIAAGPLVNVALVPVLWSLLRVADAANWAVTMPDVNALANAVWLINLGLLIFNVLPIYPLDGGQILRSLLWFPLGRARSLMAATVIGFLGAGALILFALRTQSVWLGFIVAFIVMNCWSGWQQARVLWRREKLPRRQGFACPSCKAAPPIGPVWRCSQCGTPFDTFETLGSCPSCSVRYANTGCLDCGRAFPISEWQPGAVVITVPALPQP